MLWQGKRPADGQSCTDMHSEQFAVRRPIELVAVDKYSCWSAVRVPATVIRHGKMSDPRLRHLPMGTGLSLEETIRSQSGTH